MIESSNHPDRDHEVSRLRAELIRLEQMIRLMNEQRKRLSKQQRRRLLIIGGSVSLLLHIILLIYLAMLPRAGVGGGEGGAVAIEFAVLDQEKLTESEPMGFDELESAQASFDESAITSEAVVLDAAVPAVEMAAASAGSLPTLGGAGQVGGSGSGSGGGGEGGEGFGLGGGGGAGTSFFGISSKGTRFAYIVDISGSMANDGRWQSARRELARSIDSLPDYANFYVLLFSSGFIQPPMQKGWSRANKSTVRQFVRWLNESVDPNGGTEPRTSFMQVFSLSVRPDVIFFLTDGEIGKDAFTAEELANLNSHGKKVVVNCIAFGDPSSQELLKRMAAESGGVYRYVPSGGP